MSEEQEKIATVEEVVEQLENDIKAETGRRKKKAATARPKKQDGPGRPKTVRQDIPLIHGIVPDPAQEGNIVEFVYHNPRIFKKKMSIYKAYSCSEVIMVFRADGLAIYGKDHIGKVTLCEFTNGAMINHYYCLESTAIAVKREDFDHIFNIVGKMHSKITFVMSGDARSKLYVSIGESEFDVSTTFWLNIQPVPDVAARLCLAELPDMSSDADYPIRFSVSSPHLKTTINSISSLSDVMMIQKNAGAGLVLCADNATTAKLDFMIVYNSSQKIKLDATEEDGIFAASVYIEYVSPFAGANAGETVQVRADHMRPLSLCINFDEQNNVPVCTFKAFIELKLQ